VHVFGTQLVVPSPLSSPPNDGPSWPPVVASVAPPSLPGPPPPPSNTLPAPVPPHEATALPLVHAMSATHTHLPTLRTGMAVFL
jgi:hypothetical protein